MLIRGEKLDLLVDKTEELSHTASKFKKTVRGYMQNSQPAFHPAAPTHSSRWCLSDQTKRVRNAMWWKNCRMRLIIAVALVVRTELDGCLGISHRPLAAVTHTPLLHLSLFCTSF